MASEQIVEEGAVGEREFEIQRIDEIVEILTKNEIDVSQWYPITDESCEDLSCFYNKPVLWFNGDDDEGMRAVSIAQQHGFPPSYLSRRYYVYDDEGETLRNEHWEMGFRRHKRFQLDFTACTER